MCNRFKFCVFSIWAHVHKNTCSCVHVCVEARSLWWVSSSITVYLVS